MRTVVGTMTGTSMDGVDAVAVNINGTALEMTASFISMRSKGLGPTQKILRKLTQGSGTQEEIDEAASALGRISKEAIEALQLLKIDLIALHGQTIFHQPPKSIQLIDVKPMTIAFDCDILTDPRQQDLQLGGQGAPITPLADWIMFRDSNASTAIVNLGGFCNVTILPAASIPPDIRGFDVCCCNLLLNAIALHAYDIEFDAGGEHALRGKPDVAITQTLLDMLTEQRDSKHSLGTDDDIGALVIEIGNSMKPEDLLASAAIAIGECITQSVDGIERVFLAGGGVHNKVLLNAIRHDGTTESLGVPAQAREGMAMAILGALAQDGISITLPQITGRSESMDVVGWTQASP